MQKLSTVLMVMLLTIFVFSTSGNDLLANVFASRLQILNPDSSEFDGDLSDGSGALFTFILNDTASSVSIDIIDVVSGLSVHQIEAGAMSRGANQAIWDGTGSETGKDYVYKIMAEQPNRSTTDWIMFYDSGPADIYTRGVAIFNDQMDPNFGLIYASNDAGPLRTGILVYNSDGSRHDPFLVAADAGDGGSFDYGTEAPLFAILDTRGRLYVTMQGLGKIARINRDYSVQVVIEGLTQPKGLYLEGEGEDFTIYVAADNKVLRAKVGTADTFPAGSMEVVGEFTDFYPHQIILDDDGALYATLRASNDLGSDGKGIRKYDISGNLPVKDADASWFLYEAETFIANDLLLDHGDDPETSSDDILYYCTRAGANNDQDGIWRVDDINSSFPSIIRIITEDSFYGGDENIQARATMDFDAAGNIVLMENANEHIFFISPPGEGESNSFTTTSADTFTVDVSSALEIVSDQIPGEFRLETNYPNPFNPSTVIAFNIPTSGYVTLEVFNALGQKVKTLVGKNLAPGSYQVEFDGRNLTSGTYFYQLRAGEFSDVRKMTLTK